MTITSYAQNFEDVLLWRALCDAGPGTYLDIGAEDPVHDSISLAFYEAGWRGTHVEPIPYYANRLREARPDEAIIEAAVGQAPGPIEFYEIPDTGLSTGRAEIAQRHLQHGYEPRTILVPTVRLDQLLQLTGEVHWLKIDVEGMEAEVLASWHDSPVRPWIIVIESTIPNTQEPTDHLWREHLISRGYKDAYFDGLSRYFVHEAHRDLANRLSSPPNIFDDFKVTAQHFSAATLAQNAEDAHALAEEREREHEAEIAAIAEDHANHLAGELSGVRNALDIANEALASAERDHRLTVDRMWKERHDSESLLRQQWAQAEGQLRQTLSSLKTRLRESSADLVALRETETQQSERIKELERELATVEVRLQNETADATARISGLNERLTLADDIIQKALAERSGRWQRAGRALGLAGEDRIRRVLSAWQAQYPQPTAQPVEPLMPIAPNEDASAYFLAGSLQELLSLDDLDFVRSAYATMLGREADSEGETYYVGRLRHGIPKIQILYQLRQSEEARLFPDPLPGLNSAFNRFRLLSLLHGKNQAGKTIEAKAIAQSRLAHVQQFMQYHDEDFVRVVFQYYLGRDPDPLGLEHYASRLRIGISRQQILIDVARSDEAKLRGKTAFGEDYVAKILALERIPLVGTILSILRFNLNIKNHLQDMRALQNHLYRLTKKIG